MTRVGVVEVQDIDDHLEGPLPGEVGSAVVAAHVDSRTGPAPFYRLGEVQPGASIFVDYDDGSSVREFDRSIGHYRDNVVVFAAPRRRS